jgi:hypothetical protein
MRAWLSSGRRLALSGNCARIWRAPTWRSIGETAMANREQRSNREKKKPKKEKPKANPPSTKGSNLNLSGYSKPQK